MVKLELLTWDTDSAKLLQGAEELNSPRIPMHGTCLSHCYGLYKVSPTKAHVLKMFQGP
jgi:hypothetical protein